MANSSSVTIEEGEKRMGIYRVKGNRELREEDAEERDKLSGPLPPNNTAIRHMSHLSLARIGSHAFDLTQS